MSSRTRLLVAILSTAIVGYVTAGALLGMVVGDSSYTQIAAFNEVVALIDRSYVDKVELDRPLAGARLGLTEALDGDSAYLDAEEFRRLREPVREGDGDIGALVTRRFGFIMVVATRPESPAARAGLRPGSVLKSIDGRHTRSIPVPVAQNLLRGAPGSTVKLVVLKPTGDPGETEIVRERLAPVLVSARLLADSAGYVKVTEFGPKVGSEVRAEVELLRKKGALSLVLDLRGASFGELTQGVKVAELFVKGGSVGSLAGEHVTERPLSADASQRVWDLPVALLVDNGTSGPGEIVAAALSEQIGAPLVGEHTFGRAAVQKPFPIEQGGLLLTVSRYVSPKGKVVHGQGLVPTVLVARSPEDDEGVAAPPGADLVLEKALEVLKAPPAAPAKAA